MLGIALQLFGQNDSARQAFLKSGVKQLLYKSLVWHMCTQMSCNLIVFVYETKVNLWKMCSNLMLKKPPYLKMEKKTMSDPWRMYFDPERRSVTRDSIFI